MRFTIRPFCRSHGTNATPRGDGTWAFQASRTEVGFTADLTGEIIFVAGRFGEARQQAMRRMKAEQPQVAATAPFLAVLP